MRAVRYARRRGGAVDAACVLVFSAACGGTTMQATVAPDAGPDGGLETRPDGPVADAPASDGDALDAVADAPADLAPAVDAVADGDAADATKADVADATADATSDVGPPPSATATFTLAPGSMCAAAGVGCMDTGAVGGYQLTASGACPTASGIQLWFPGGAAPLPAGAYAVKPAAGILDVIAMPAGKVGVLAERDDPSGAHFKFWGRSGTVTVTAAGTARHVTFSGVSVREESTAVATTLAGDVTCP